tara:strand:- start:2402 stop:2560 length:159 start_codon:yes stop_codon:yes gene_type:complete
MTKSSTEWQELAGIKVFKNTLSYNKNKYDSDELTSAMKLVNARINELDDLGV